MIFFQCLQDNPGESFGGDNDVWYQYVEGGAGLDHGLAACSDDDRDLEAAVNCLAEQVENIGIIEHVLNKEEDEVCLNIITKKVLRRLGVQYN